MESRIRVLLLIACALMQSGCSLWPFSRKHAAVQEPVDATVGTTAANAAAPAVVEPEVVRRKVKTPKIKTSNFEVGPYVGTFSIEDFGVNPVYGGRLAYHISEDFFAEALIGRTNAGRTSYETLSGGANLLTTSQRQLTYYDLAFGYNLFPGEVFIGRRRAFNSAFYVTGGVGGTHFAGDSRFTVMMGAGYRLLLNDWLAAHLDVRDHIFDIDLLGTNKTSHNLETSLGVTVYF
jgi:outer membrane beta-barrel protein